MEYRLSKGTSLWRGCRALATTRLINFPRVLNRLVMGRCLTPVAYENRQEDLGHKLLSCLLMRQSFHNVKIFLNSHSVGRIGLAIHVSSSALRRMD